MIDSYLIGVIIGGTIGLILTIVFFVRLRNIDAGLENIEKTLDKLLEHYDKKNNIYDPDLDNSSNNSNDKTNSDSEKNFWWMMAFWHIKIIKPVSSIQKNTN